MNERSKIEIVYGKGTTLTREKSREKVKHD